MSFHDVRFPEQIALGATGGPTWSTQIITTASGAEQRNAAWAQARGRWNVGTGLRSRADLQVLLASFGRGGAAPMASASRTGPTSSSTGNSSAPPPAALPPSRSPRPMSPAPPASPAASPARSPARSAAGSMAPSAASGRGGAVPGQLVDRDRHHRIHARGPCGQAGRGAVRVRRPGALRYRRHRGQPAHLSQR
jgi:hypothetical protein